MASDSIELYNMHCDTCERPFTTANGCTCTVCARNILYDLRMQQATVLLEKEKLGKHIEVISKGCSDSSLKASASSFEQTISLGTSTGGMLVDRFESAKRVDLDSTLLAVEGGADRVKQILEKAARLRKDIDQAKKEIAVRQSSNTRLRSDLLSVNNGLSERRAADLDKLSRDGSRWNRKWDAVHDETAKSRAYLCKEAAQLMGLKYMKRRSKEGVTRNVYYLGTNRIYDLREMNGAHPDMLTSCFNNLAMLLTRIAHYLSVRLPAEIICPHRDYPRPTVSWPQHSYLAPDDDITGASPAHSSSNSPEASRSLDTPHSSRPRALYLDRPLPQLYKEDPQAYRMFIEAVALLTWDIAWLCKSQGLPTDFSNWEEMCPLGKNLYNLLIVQPASIPEPSSKDSPRPTMPVVTLGQQSHGTAHSFLRVASDNREWRITSIPRLADHIKAALIAEMQGAEWEVLSEKEWNEMDAEMKEEPVLVGARRQSRSTADRRSVLSALTEGSSRREGSDRDDTSAQATQRRAKGWTHVKSRASEH